MRERAIQFGSHRGLVGIVTTPDPTPDAPRPTRAIVMANVGLHHRVGPYRLYVDLARRLAARGFAALRFDLSGLGDSAARPGTMTDTERGILDMTEGMAWLEAKLGIREFIVIGLCSGVDVAHPIAVNDPRVVGAIFIDGYTYSTVGSTLRHHTLRYLQLPRWTRMIARMRSGGDGDAPAAPAGDQQMFVRDYPEQTAFRDDIDGLVKRGTRLLFIWTGTYGQFNSERQLFEMLGATVRNGNVDLEHMTGADHVFTAIAERDRLVTRIADWMTKHRGATR